jgi:hypothetical protein
MKRIPLFLAAALLLGAGSVLAEERGNLPPPPSPGQASGYIVPTINRSLDAGAQAGGSYTTSGGTTYHGYVSGNSRGGEGGASVTLPCGKWCGN